MLSSIVSTAVGTQAVNTSKGFMIFWVTHKKVVRGGVKNDGTPVTDCP